MNYITLEKLKSLLDEYLVENINVYDSNDRSPYFDWLVICDCSNEKVVTSVANKLLGYCKENDISIRLCENKNPSWIIIDFYNIVLHIFKEQERSYYNIDSLWNTEDIIEVKDSDSKNEE